MSTPLRRSARAHDGSIRADRNNSAIHCAPQGRKHRRRDYLRSTVVPPARKRLSKWQRFGIVASIIWALGAASYQRNADVQRLTEHALFESRLCLDANDKLRTQQTENWQRKNPNGKLSGWYDLGEPAGLRDCSAEFAKNWIANAPVWSPWGNVVVAALLPIPFGWLAVYVIVKAVRWIRAGN
jgi:hypothetical protein